MPNLLFLFDIDGTLVRRAGPHHRMALVEATRRVTGTAAPIDHVPVQGMLDPVILATMLRDVGLSSARIRRVMPELIREAQRVYLETAPRDLRSKTAPAARATLARLRRLGVPAGLVTGNLSRIAWRKIAAAGLRNYLSFGAFAEAADDRATLAKLAMQEARRKGWLSVRTRVWLVGDHENDIRAAKANGIGVISVATGISTKQELALESPDVLVDDLTQLDWTRL